MNLFVFGLGYSRSGSRPACDAGRGSRVAGTVRDRARQSACGREGIAAFMFDDERQRSTAEIAKRRRDPRLDSARRTARSGLRAISRPSRIAPVGSPGSATSRPPASMAIRAAAGSTRRVPPDPRNAAPRGASRPRRPGSSCGARRQGRRDLPPRRHLRAGSERSHEAALRHGARGSSSRARSPTASTSTTSRRVLAASIARPRPGAIYNVVDDEPAPPQDVVAYAARLAGIPAAAGNAVRGGRAQPDGASFYAREQARLEPPHHARNSACALRYPTYREGLQALYASGE